MFALTITRADVLLEEGSDRIGAVCPMKLRVKLGEPVEISGRVSADSRLRYDRQSFCFYLVDPVIREADIEGVPARYTKNVAKHSRDILRHVGNEIPVYVITDDRLKKKLARAVLKDVRVRNGRVEVGLGY